MEKASPPDPLRENFRRFGLMVVDCLQTEVKVVLVVMDDRGAPPNGAPLPNRRLCLCEAV